MAIDNIEALLDALTDTNSTENHELMETSERKANEMLTELEVVSNRLRFLQRGHRKWYRTYRLTGGRPIDRHEAALAQTQMALYSPEELEDVKQLQSLQLAYTSPPPKPPVVVETAYGEEMVDRPTRKYTRRARQGITPGDVAAFFKLAYDEIKEPIGLNGVANYFGVSKSHIAILKQKAEQQGLMGGVVVPRSGAHTPFGQELRILQKFGRYQK